MKKYVVEYRDNVLEFDRISKIFVNEEEAKKHVEFLEDDGCEAWITPIELAVE